MRPLLAGDDSILVNGRRIPEATPVSLVRRLNSAAEFRFRVPIKSLPSWSGIQPVFRQGSRIEYRHAGALMFYGYLPSVSYDRGIGENAAWVDVSAHDFVGQLQEARVTLGTTSSSYLDPAGQEVGGAVAQVVGQAASRLSNLGDLRTDGVRGTHPLMTVAAADARYGDQTAKAALDWLTALAFDDSRYPENPLLYEYQQRGNAFTWRKELVPNQSNSSLSLMIGVDAFLDGMVQSMPVYTEANVAASDGRVWTHVDEDAARRRWDGRRYAASGSVSSVDSADAQALAVRLVELGKNERTLIDIAARREAALLYPGDIVAVYNPQSRGLPYVVHHRIREVRIGLTPTPRTSLILGDRAPLLTDYVT